MLRKNAIYVIERVLGNCWSFLRIEFVKFSSAAITPTKGSADAAGYDLYSFENVLVLHAMVKLIRTDIGFKIPKGYFGKISARSSFILCFTDVGGGVIDTNYRGPVTVVFFNFSSKSVETEKGTQFAQIIFQKIVTPTLREVEKFMDLTQRDTGLFGSIGSGFKHVW